MQIGISTASFYPLAIEQGVELVSSLGFRKAELFINSESEYVPPFRDELKRQLDALGIEVVSIHPYTSAIEGHLLFSDYPRRTQDALDQYQKYFAAAAALGAKYFTFHGERLRSIGLPPSRSEHLRYETYRQICKRAKTEGITFTQENVSWCQSSQPEFLKGLLENVPELRYTLDLKQAYRADRKWEEYIDLLGDKIVNLHISDYNEQSDCLLPGSGSVDYKKLFAKLDQIGYNGCAMIEVYSSDYTNPNQLRESREHLERLSKIGI